MNRPRSPLFCHWVIEPLIRHSSFGFSHSLACATQVHGLKSFPWNLPNVIFRFSVCIFVVLLATGCSGTERPVVIIYTSQDQVYAEPILQRFKENTGIEVRALYDSEAVKTVGLANRLLAEHRRPRCDVFWSNEELRTHQLAAQNIFREDDPWHAVGYRSRRMVINTNLLPIPSAPHRFSEVTNAAWRGKVALAYPLFGTTATHFLALRQSWGDARWQAWCRALQQNKPFLVDGNSVVVKLVGQGEAWIGFTDSDDVAAAQREGLPVAALDMNEETLAIPNTVAVIRDAPHPIQAQKLFEHLQDQEVLRTLVNARALEGSSLDVLSLRGKTLEVDWDSLLKDIEPATATLKHIFLR
jgi:iron(III) transport system substrate-binding protein